MLGNVPDSFTSRGASALALEIQMFWSGLGLSGVKAWIEPLSMIENGTRVTLFQVRSNLCERILALAS